jgi:hypothetical protein
MPAASAGTEAVIARMFPKSERHAVRRILVERCGRSLPGLNGADELEVERIRFAVL